MDTKKLYYEDCHLRSFSATVLCCEQTARGWLITLDQTAFYPEGGGQACDLGTLEHANVLDVKEREGTIVHLCDSALTIGSKVTGTIQWDRRLDQMQQHAGEHIVSGLIHKHFGCHNVGFHVGADVVTIDFDAPLTWPQLQLIEAEANNAIWDNRPIHCWYPAPDALSHITYRSKKALPWPVRIVEIPGCDTCACCGVHVASTGQIGLIKLLTCVKFHEGVRIEMACGRRALNLLSQIYEQNRQVSQAFSAKPLETGDAAKRMNEQLSAEKFRAGNLERRFFDTLAATYRDRGNILHFESGLTGSSVRDLADRTAQTCGGIAAVFSGDDTTGYNFCMISTNTDVKPLCSALTQAFNGRGGGKPGFFQGNVRATRNQLELFMQQKVSFYTSC